MTTAFTTSSGVFRILRTLRRRLLREIVTLMLFASLMLQSVQAAAPGWWSTQGAINSQKLADDYAALNQGQLKNFVRAAIYELHAKLPGGAGSLLNNLLNTWRTQKLGSDDYATVTVGQLKAVAKPVYASMQAAGIQLPLPWTELTTDDDDYSTANLGQAKAVFAFVVPNLALMGQIDTDGDGFSDALELVMGTDPNSAASHPTGINGDMAYIISGGGGGGGSGGSGGGLPPYVDPYADDPWPDFDSTEDADKDTDDDGVPDKDDRVWYDANFKEQRSGMPHYCIVDMGKGYYADMADNGALLWSDSNTYKVWTPDHPQVVSIPWNPYDAESIGLENASWASLNGNISEDGTLSGVGYYDDQSPGGVQEPLLFFYHPDASGGTAEWLTRPVPGGDDETYTSYYLFGTVFGPGGKLYGANDFYSGAGEDRLLYTTFWTAGEDAMSFQSTQVEYDTPPLPDEPPAAGTTLTPDDSLGEAIGLDVYNWDIYFQGSYAASGTGLLRSSISQSRTYYKRVVRPEYDYGDGSARAWAGMDGPDYESNTLKWELVTSGNTRQIKVLDLTNPQDAWFEPYSMQYITRWFFGAVSPAQTPWFVGSKNDGDDFWDVESYIPHSWIYKPDSSGNYQPYSIYASKKDKEDGKPITGMGLITAQGQVMVYGEFDDENEGDEAGMWADGEVETMNNIIGGYDRYDNWGFCDVSRDGMIAANATKEVDGEDEYHMLLLIPITTREIKEDGTLASGGGVQVSFPSPVFCSSVAADGTPQGKMSCALQNLRVQDDGSILGDLQISGSLASKACDNVKGDMGTITQAQLWVNDADTAQATINVDASGKETTGTKARPYPFAGTFGTTIADVPLTAGVNTFKFTAADPVYQLPGSSTWTVTVNVTDPSGDDDESGSGPGGTFALRVQLPGATLVPETADTVQAMINLNGTVFNGVALTETSNASGVFAGTLTDGRPVRLTLAVLQSVSATVQDTLQATLLVGQPGAAVTYQTNLQETNRATGLFVGGYTDVVAATGGGGSTGGGGATGSDPTNTDGDANNGGNNNATGGNNGAAGQPSLPTGLEPVVTISDAPYEAMDQLEATNGGEYHGYAVAVGVPEALKDSLKLEFGEDEYGLVKDSQSGLMLLKSSGGGGQENDAAPLTASFMPHLDPEMDDPPGVQENEPDADDQEYQKRMDDLKDASFAKGFAWGLGYGGLDMVKSTGESIVGAAKFVGRGVMQVGLRFTWAANWITGQDNTAVNEWITEVDAAQGKVVGQGVEMAKFLGSLLVDTAVILPKLEVGLLTGDMELINTALHGGETHRKVFAMVSEVLTQTAADLTGDQRSSGQKGYIIGKIVYEVVSFVLPMTKAGKVLEMTKSKLLGKLIDKADKMGGKLLRQEARNVANATKTAVDATKMCFVAGTLIKAQSGAMKIEQVHAGTVVWSRDEYTQQEGWKRVLRTFVTHPAELYHLTYELRGPPVNGGNADTPAHAVVTETLGVTAPHPFWVCNREVPGFVMAEDLHEGDELLVADGRYAVVNGKVLERAPAGRTFTTYNFEVEDYHTYFAGREAVWVHNNNNGRAPCEVAISIFQRYRKKNSGDVWNSFGETIGKLKQTKNPEVLNQKVFNEARKKYFDEGVVEPGPWLNKNGVHQTFSYAADGSPIAKSENLANNLEKVLGYDKIPFSEAHHIIPKGEPGAAELRGLLKKFNVHPDDASNGTFMIRQTTRNEFGSDSGWLDGLGPDHQSHGASSAYIDQLNDDLAYFKSLPATPQNTEMLKNTLQEIASKIVDGSYPWP